MLSMSIYLDDPLAGVRASLLHTHPVSNERFFVTIPQAYCTQVPTAVVNRTLCNLIDSLHRFEMRTDKKAKRRLVRGYRETLRHLRQGHIKLLVVAIDIDSTIMEHIDGPRLLLEEAKQRAIPIVFALRREEMTAALGRPPHIETSILGILNPEGAYQAYQELATWSLEATARWTEMALAITLEELRMNPESMILQVLTQNGHLSILSLLTRDDEKYGLLRGCINRACRVDGRTALMIAAALGEIEIATILIEAGADILQRDFALETSLHHAARSGSLAMIRLVASTFPEASLMRNASDRLPIHQAISYDHAEVVNYMASLMVMPKALLMDCLRCVFFKNRPSEDTLVILLRHPEQLESGDWTELVTLCSKSNTLGCLRTVLTVLKKHKNHDEIRKIIDQETSAESGTPAWIAAYLGNVAIARELIKNGANAEFSLKMHDKFISINSLLEKWKMAARSQG